MFSTIQLTEKSFQKPLCVCRQFPVCAKVSKCLLILDPRVVSSVLPLWLISCLLAVVEHNVIVTKTSAVQTQTRNTGALFSYARLSGPDHLSTSSRHVRDILGILFSSMISSCLSLSSNCCPFCSAFISPAWWLSQAIRSTNMPLCGPL